MSNRYAYIHTVVLLVVIAVGSSAMGRQARQAAAPAQAPAAAGPGNVNLNLSQVTMPVSGKPYRFSLCLGRLLNPGEVSAPCRAAQSTRAVGGAAGNAVVTFRLENGSFLPPGLHLDGFGVISGTTDVDVSKLTVKICAIQLGAYGTNFNCQGQPVGFGKEVAFGNTPPPPPPTVAPVEGGGGSSGGKTLAVAAGAAAAAGTGLYASGLLSGLSGPDCSSQKSAMDSSMTALGNAVNALAACGSNFNCVASRQGAVNNAISSVANAGGNYCVCMGGADIPESEKAELRALLQGLGNSAGSLPSCFR